MYSALLHIFAASLSAVVIIFSKPPKELSGNTQTYIYPPNVLRYFTFGYHETFADSLWIRVTQDFDYCETGKEVSANRGTNLDEIVTPASQEPRCAKGWVYHMVDSVTELAPLFRVAHLRGATILSILADDREGAKLIFDKGVSRFPQDWQLIYRAAYHYLFELHEPLPAAELLLKAHKAGGPSWLPSLAARLYSKAAQYELARSVLVSFLKENPDGPGSERARQRLEEITKEANSEP